MSSIHISEIVDKIIEEWNVHERKAREINPKIKPFCKDDFNYPFSCIQYVGSIEKVNIESLIIFSNANIWEDLSLYQSRKSIWYWEGIDDSGFIVNMNQYINNIIQSFLALIREDQIISAFMIFRVYVEVSCLFFASLLDVDFYNSYVNQLTGKEYVDEWYKSLRPSKVQKFLKNLQEKSSIDNNIPSLQYPFHSPLREKLYEELSSYCHGKYSIIDSREIKGQLLWMICEYLSYSTSNLRIMSKHFLKNSFDIDERKHLFILSLWDKLRNVRISY
jgi:hypothetical protein